jgi:hypothetical protein
MKEGKIPTRKEIGIKKITRLLENFQDQKNFSRALELMSPAWKDAVAKMNPEEIVARFLGMTLPEVFAERERGPERSEAPSSRPARDSRSYGGRRDQVKKSTSSFSPITASRVVYPQGGSNKGPKNGRSRVSGWNRPLSRS